MNKSFLKWAGGKSKLLSKLQELGINEGKRFIEPFVGSGVVSLNMPHKTIIIGDSNLGLINLWGGLMDGGEDFIKCCQEVFETYGNTEKSYYKAREVFNKTHSGALFLYLNKHCFNGLCRFNAKGEFNVPYNHRKTVPGFPEEELRHAIEVSDRMVYPQVCSFVDMFRLVKKGDMVYCDPPYLPAGKNGFVNYSKDGFSFSDQCKLADCAIEAQKKGATVIISNNNTLESRTLYKKATEVHFIDVQKNISCKGDGRKKQSEIIAVYRP